jgi:transposase, IS5 family
MYRKETQFEFEEYRLQYQGILNSENRWVKFAAIIPWEKVEEEYKKQFDEEIGAPAKSGRLALGALLIKEKLNITDEETVEQIRENPYLQYFLGQKSFQDEAPFNSSMMVYFRKRLGSDILKKVNEWIHEDQLRKEKKEDDGESTGGNNKGQLIADATCAPQDIRFPTDVDLLNEAREKTEKIIDILHTPSKGKEKKVRTYRLKARWSYLNFIKKRHPKERDIRKAIREQLQYLQRNLRYIKEISEKTSLKLLSKQEYRNLLVISEVYRQQEQMYRERTHSITGRIVSITQPHVRPIVRGKAAAPVEFGAKISVSLVAGFVFVDRISWDAYHEAEDLIQQIEQYKKRYGYYPESVHVDKIYRTRANRAYCRERNIRISGPRLGRPLKDRELLREEVKQLREDEAKRVEVEGKFGQVKRRFNIGKIYEKLQVTSETAIMLGFLLANCEKVLRDLFYRFFLRLSKTFLNRILVPGNEYL